MQATNPADILKYASVGVSKSAGIWAHIGTRFGGYLEDDDLDKRFSTTSKVGLISD